MKICINTLLSAWSILVPHTITPCLSDFSCPWRVTVRKCCLYQEATGQNKTEISHVGGACGDFGGIFTSPGSLHRSKARMEQLCSQFTEDILRLTSHINVVKCKGFNHTLRTQAQMSVCQWFKQYVPKFLLFSDGVPGQPCAKKEDSWGRGTGFKQSSLWQCNPLLWDSSC